MKNIIFTVKPNEKTAIVNIINGLKAYSGRCRIDFVTNKIDVDVGEDEEVNEIIDFIDRYYTILRIDMVKNQECDEKHGETVVEFLDNGEFVINNIHYNSSELKVSLDKFLKVMNLALASEKRISIEEICQYVDTCKQEMTMGYNPKTHLHSVKAGDIVTVSFGMHADGELNGEICSIVCDVNEKTICVVPIMKDVEYDPDDENWFQRKFCKFYDKFAPRGSLAFNKARYLRIDRVVRINGNVSDEYLREIKTELAQAFNFLSE